MKDTTKKEIEKILNFYEMTGSYIEGAKRHDYKHYNKLSKENIIRELAALFESKLPKEPLNQDWVGELNAKSAKKEIEQLKKEFEEKWGNLWSTDKYGDPDKEINEEILNWFDSQIDRIREDSVNEIFDLIQCRGENCMWCRGNGDCGNMLTDEFVKNRRKQFKEYLESKSGGIK
jgi:hypothetical protein